MQIPPQKTNPLLGLMRQPKIYITLPSQGKYWPDGSLQRTPTNEYPVYSMTARDELILKTPDALLNGQAVADVIQSCVPNILDGWQCPQTDIDAILIAIRLATYGEFMDTTVTVKGVDATYGIDLKDILAQLVSAPAWDERIEIASNLVIYVRPLNYRELSKASAESFETQRIINLVNDKAIDEDKKLELFADSFNKLTKMTLDLVSNTIYRIDTTAGSVTEREFISEFMQNCDKNIFNAVKNHLDKLKDDIAIKPLRVKATDEMVAAGSAEEVEVPLTFDPSTFFG